METVLDEIIQKTTNVLITKTIYSTLLDIALGPRGAGNAAANVFLRLVSTCSRLRDSQKSLIGAEITESSKGIRSYVSKFFQQHFAQAGVGRRSDDLYSAQILYRTTATAVFLAAKARVKHAVEASKNHSDPKVYDDCMAAQRVLKVLSGPSEDISFIDRLRLHLNGLADIIDHQIVHIPSLLQPKSPYWHDWQNEY